MFFKTILTKIKPDLTFLLNILGCIVSLTTCILLFNHFMPGDRITDLVNYLQKCKSN